jgi:tRNA threonylcarbamoyladenosine biosynthesis protein TsaE
MPILEINSLELISRSTEQTRRVGMRLGAYLSPGDLICLEGDLGSGKTTLVQGISTGWGSLDPVSSPTFVLVNVYRGQENQTLFHLDAYRLSGPSEAIELDIDGLLEHGPMIIEWADRIRTILPKECLWIQLNYVEQNQRDFLITAYGEHYRLMLSDFRKKAFGIK